MTERREAGINIIDSGSNQYCWNLDYSIARQSAIGRTYQVEGLDMQDCELAQLKRILSQAASKYGVSDPIS